MTKRSVQLWRACTCPSPPLPLKHTRRWRRDTLLRQLLAPSQPPVQTPRPFPFLVRTEPIASSKLHHDPTQLPPPPLPSFLALGKRILRIFIPRIPSLERKRRAGRLRRRDNMLTQHAARVGRHDEDEVDAQRPEARNDDDARDATGLKERGVERALRRGGVGGGGGVRDEKASVDHVHRAYVVVFGRGEACRVVHCLLAGEFCALA